MTPYAASEKSASGTHTPIRWRRVLVWAVAINLATMLLGFLGGLSLAFWEVYGDTLEKALENARYVRLASYVAVAAILYWQFAIAAASRRWLHVAVIALAAELVGIASSLLLGDSFAELLDPWAWARSLLALVLGWALTSLWPNNSFKPNPLRRFVDLCRR